MSVDGDDDSGVGSFGVWANEVRCRLEKRGG